MLVLLLRVGDQRFGLDARDVVEVVPAVPLLPATHAPAWIAGLLRHRDGIAPVVDLSRLVRGEPAPARLSTRIVLLYRQRESDPAGAAGPTGLGDDAAADRIGLLAEGVTEILRLDDERQRDAGLRATPWLGPMALDVDGPVQLVRWTDLVPPSLRAAVLEGAPA
jgi:chemotaxis-related protein WspB